MQEGITSSPTWTQIALGLIAAFFTGGGIFKIWDTWLNRKKPAAELHVTEETATEIRLRSHSTATDLVVKMMNRLDEAQVTIDRVRSERDAWEGQYGEVFTEKVRIQHENERLRGENESYEKQIKRMQRTLADNNLNYDNTQDKPIGPVPDTDCE